MLLPFIKHNLTSIQSKYTLDDGYDVSYPLSKA